MTTGGIRVYNIFCSNLKPFSSTKAEFCARLGDIVSASWDFTFLFTEDFADNKGVYKKYDRYV